MDCLYILGTDLVAAGFGEIRWLVPCSLDTGVIKVKLVIYKY